ncbi:MAG: calcium-binding protein [bacterium]|nr:calcium-binding protein [bacterium]
MMISCCWRFTVAAGLVQVDGSTANSAFTIASGATLGGNGTVGAVVVQSGGTIAPGASVGHLITGSLDLDAGADFVVEIGGTNAGTQYDRISANGPIDLERPTLSLLLVDDFDPDFGDAFKIIDNNSGDPVTGSFDSLAEGDQAVLDGRAFSITYRGGHGNDVVLKAIQAVINGTSGDDIINGTNTVHGELPATDGDDIINGKNGDDTLSGIGGADKISGNKGKDALKGNKGKDALNGGNGNDTLDGGPGDDVLNGGSGDNAFRFSSDLGDNNVDRIKDFESGDIIQLSFDVFKNIGSDGQLKSKYFVQGSNAENKDQRIIYHKSKGDLFQGNRVS